MTSLPPLGLFQIYRSTLPPSSKRCMGVAYILFAYDIGLSIALDAAEKRVTSMTERTPIKHQRRAPTIGYSSRA